ncbi:hypothetical protein [Microbulbifer taiwanensis]|uniref:hypothetical protein n=1 Tax=Microbulbifer taiwanensis TaxID=986746 RepID=UPI00360907D9
MQGVNESYALTLDHKFRRSRDFNLTGSFSLTDKESELEAIIELPEPGDHVLGGEFGLYMDSLSNGAVPMLNILNAKIQYGEHQNTVDPERGGNFGKFAADTSSLLFIPMPFSDVNSRLILKSRWQYSDKSLPAFEQFSSAVPAVCAPSTCATFPRTRRRCCRPNGISIFPMCSIPACSAAA